MPMKSWIALIVGIFIAAPAWAAEGVPISQAALPGVSLRYIDSGGVGAPVILLHANTGTIESWDNQVVALRGAGFRVIAFDRRGWGGSVADPSSGPQPGSVAGDLDALATYLKLETFDLVGVAGGGFVALDYAAWKPDRVRSMVVAATSGQMAEAEMKEFSARIEFTGFRDLPPVNREVGPSYLGGNPAGAKRWMEIEEHARQKGAPEQKLRSPNTYAKIAAIPTPTLVLAGDADMVSPPEMMRRWSAHLRSREFDIVPEAGHSIAWEQPEVFNRKMLGFLRRH
jgi:pimeloyl-ACP methyl ester carboxylesterase